MAKKILFGLFGASGFGREVMPFVRETLPAQFGASLQIVFVETNPTERMINGVSVFSEQEFLDHTCDKKYFNITIANSKIREQVAVRCEAGGAKPLSLQAPNVLVYDANEVGGGAILCPFSMITANTKIGKYFHSNIYSYVAHDCVIGDYVTFGPRVNCNGNIHIGNHAYIGTNAVLIQGKKGMPLVIGEGAIIGLGAVVTRNVPPHTTVMGNPARALFKQVDAES